MLEARQWLRAAALACALAAAARAEDALDADKKALVPLKDYVGSWKGAGLPKGGAGKDGWSEESEWAWQFQNGHAALTCASPKGKFFSAGKLTPGEKAGAIVFTGTLPDGKSTERYTGSLNAQKELILTAEQPAEGRPAQFTIGLLAKGDRMVVNFEKKSGEKFAPLAEVGLTRKGSGFGKDKTAHECVITGGKGIVAVEYKGQTYYVCCGGCKETFLENPEKELAAWRERKAQEKAEEEKAKQGK